MGLRSCLIGFSFILLSQDSIGAPIQRFYNARLIINHTIKSGELWIQDGKIIAPQSQADQSFDLHGSLVAPGYIDLQINGAFGIDFSYQPERVDEAAAKLPQHGVTAFVPTLVSLSPQQYRKAIPQLQPRKGNGAEILGIHLEGPYFSPKQFGAHNPKMLADSPDLEQMYGNIAGVKIVTLAPELSGIMPIIKQLRDRGIVISVGHTMATYEDMQQAKGAGVALSTHLFNAMTPYHHRNPGVVGAVLNDNAMHYSVIADGVHLHPATLNLAWKSNPNGLVLVTDAIQALGYSDGTYKLGDMTVDVKQGAAHIQGTTTIAGSVLSMDQAVRNLRQQTGCSIIDAIEAATLKPAKVLGIEKQKGTLNVGADADFVVLDDNLNVKSTYVAGRLSWQG